MYLSLKSLRCYVLEYYSDDGDDRGRDRDRDHDHEKNDRDDYDLPGLLDSILVLVEVLNNILFLIVRNIK